MSKKSEKKSTGGFAEAYRKAVKEQREVWGPEKVREQGSSPKRLPRKQ